MTGYGGRVEQRKSSLKKIENELDEAEEIVSPPSLLPRFFPSSLFPCLFPITISPAPRHHHNHRNSPPPPPSVRQQISQMEVELPSMPLSIRSPYTTRLSTSKTDLLRLKKTIQSLQREGQRSDLLSGGRGNGGKGKGGSYPGGEDEPYSDEPGGGYDREQRSRLLAGTETLNDGEAHAHPSLA